MPPSNPIHGQTTKILVLNPNSSQTMTDGMRAAILDPILGLPYSTEVHTYTAPPSAPASIDDGADIAQSTDAVLADFKYNDRDAYDGILVACFSVHPLVQKLHQQRSSSSRAAVIGIFEASILTALSLLPPLTPPPAPAPAPASLPSNSYGQWQAEQQQQQRWGIVTTGKFWEDHLSEGVRHFLGDSGVGTEPNSRFAGVQSTGLNASDFHNGVSPEVVRRKLKEATRRLLSSDHQTTVIVMGCAGMAGLEEIIREAAAEEVDGVFAYEVLHVVDGVRAGILQIETMIKHQRLRRPRSTT